MLISSGCTLPIFPPVTFIRVVLHISRHYLASDACYVLCKAAYRILPEDPEVGGL